MPWPESQLHRAGSKGPKVRAFAAKNKVDQEGGGADGAGGGGGRGGRGGGHTAPPRGGPPPPPAEHPATSLLLETGTVLSRAELLAAFLDHLEREYDAWVAAVRQAT